MTSPEMRRMFAYNAWANDRLLAALRQVPPEACDADGRSSHGGMRSTMTHVVWAHELWLLRWLGLPQEASVERAGRTASIADLEAYWRDVDRRTNEFLDAHPGDELFSKTFRMKTTKGESYTHTYGESMRHLLLHSGYHRGQVVTLLRQAGVVPPVTDYIVFERLTRPETRG